jgi:hypothetical protein
VVESIPEIYWYRNTASSMLSAYQQGSFPNAPIAKSAYLAIVSIHSMGGDFLDDAETNVVRYRGCRARVPQVMKSVILSHIFWIIGP